MLGNSVYIVDDDADVRQSVAFFLAAAGFITRSFADPQVFLADVNGLAPGCVLLDIRMPDIDGFEVLERLKSQQSPLLAVVMTGHGDVVTAVRAMKLGAVDFLEKPFEEEVLLQILSRTFATLGDSLRDRNRRRDARARLDALTDREREVLIALLAGRAKQVLLNLLRNAAESVAAATVRRITITTAATSACRCEVTVRDSGRGVSAAFAERLFEPFNTSKRDGMGTGLSISKTIIEAHGGLIWHEAAGGGGAIFGFSLVRVPS